ncbi:MAG: alpha/beta hydrolase-fold protein [Deltaproteobacteria bacterium]|nr:alpha/beta hydrolase-fold protein [Deltaproteobacteria bacterium]
MRRPRSTRAAALAVAVAAVFAGPGAAAIDDGSAQNPATETVFTPGPDGFVSTWLVLGPLANEPSDATMPAVLWAPEALPRSGARTLSDRWTWNASSEEGASLDRKKTGTAYLAALLRTPRARRLWAATGSDGPLRAWLSGKEAFRTDTDRRAVKDTDLFALDLVAGDNLLVIATKHPSPGPFRVFLRLMDEAFGRPADLTVVLPGLGESPATLVGRTGSLRLERSVDLDKAAASAAVILDFPGGAPVLGSIAATVSADGGPDKTRSATIDLTAAGSATARLTVLGWNDGTIPKVVEIEAGGARWSARVAMRMGDVKALATASADMGSAARLADVPRTSVESVAARVDTLTSLVRAGDEDTRYLGSEIGLAAKMAKELAAGRDPFAGRRGEIQRRGYRSAIDGSYRYYALYVPRAWREQKERRFGLIVALHGMNGLPISMIQSVFGVADVPGETKISRERAPKPMNDQPFFVLAPEAFGNSWYRTFGEVDVLEAVARVMERYRIDPDRVYMTGASMGGIGAASIPLHYPDMFATAVPLCGYHSVLASSSLAGVTLLPWEKLMASARSNTSWAENGRHLPLYLVHGTKDQPRTSSVLVDRYKQLGYDVTFETPDLGHNVWDEAYKGGRIFEHFRKYRRDMHPRHVTFLTANLRYRTSRWLSIDDVAEYGAWAKIDAVWERSGALKATTENVAALTVARDEALAKGTMALSIAVDGQAPIALDGPGPFALHKDKQAWLAGPAIPCAQACKRPGLSGPIEDAFYEPLVFVYGTADKTECAITKRIALSMSNPGNGTFVHWPVKADTEITAEDMKASSLVIIGTPRGNRLLASMNDALPVHAKLGAVIAGDTMYSGETVAAAFIHPNPLEPSRYVLVYTGASARALYYAEHLPGLLPDYVVFDASSWGRKGGLALDGRPVLAAGFFDHQWKIAK